MLLSNFLTNIYDKLIHQASFTEKVSEKTVLAYRSSERGFQLGVESKQNFFGSALLLFFDCL